MFETEDMLPRQPPEPSAPPLTSNGFVKPEVPEVSIIFGKNTTTAQLPSQQQPTSYADWKKMVLPRATQQTGAKNENNANINRNVATRSAVFPLRTASAPAFETSNTHHEDVINSNAEKSFRHSLENQTTTPTATLSKYTPSSEHRRSVDSLSQRSNTAFSTESVLTICASTQTDAAAAASHAKQDLECLMKAISDLQEEQRQTRRLLEVFIVQQEQKQKQQMMTSNVYCCDMATQCDLLRDEMDATSAPNVSPQIHFQLENNTVHQALPNVKIYSPVAPNVCRATLPTAQSTQYRDNTPLKNVSSTQQSAATRLAATPSNTYRPVLPKPNTDKSMVMNELALKYLPTEKFNELMQNTNSNAETVPLREIDNFNKAPTDISTASFQYLRKYRLLPHQQKHTTSNDGSPTAPLNTFNTPEYRQQIGQQQPTDSESPHLDLEHIRRQPKFL